MSFERFIHKRLPFNIFKVLTWSGLVFDVPSIQGRFIHNSGVDLSKILGGQTKILWGQKVLKGDKCMSVSQLLGMGHVPGLPQKATPMTHKADLAEA